MSANYEYYKVFYYVAKYGNITRASEALMSNQPNVTRIVRLLEHELGCRLFVRSNRGVALTAEGEKLYRHVVVAFEQIRIGEEELSRSVGLQDGTVSIGASEIALHIYLLDRLEQFHRLYPNVRLKIYNHTAGQALEALKAGQIDYAVVTTMTEVRVPFEQKYLRSFQDILVGGPDAFSLSVRPISLKELGGHSLICLEENTATYRFFYEFYRKHGLVLTPDVEAATMDLVLPMVEKNLGIGFLPEEFAAEALRRRRIFRIPLKETIPQRSVILGSDTGRTLSLAAQTLRKMLCDTQKE